MFGSSTAGGAYHPALSDYSIFVKGQAQVFLGGPPLVKMATGEVVDAEELGGAETHAKITGLADQIATDESVYPVLGLRSQADMWIIDLMQSEKPASGCLRLVRRHSWTRHCNLLRSHHDIPPMIYWH